MSASRHSTTEEDNDDNDRGQDLLPQNELGQRSLYVSDFSAVSKNRNMNDHH